MRRFIVAIFAGEKTAYEGVRALNELSAEGSLVLYGMTVVTREADGRLSHKQSVDQGPVGIAVGGLTGALIGLIGGPVGAAVGLSGGALVGGGVDLLDLGVSAQFIDEVSAELTPGRWAVIADVVEEWMTPLDLRMEAIGGIVIREWRADVTEDIYAREIAARKEGLEQLKTEFSRASEENRAKLHARIDTERAKLQEAVRRAEAWFEARKVESGEKIEELESMIASAVADRKAKLEARLAELRESLKRRGRKLQQARELVKEALSL